MLKIRLLLFHQFGAALQKQSRRSRVDDVMSGKKAEELGQEIQSLLEQYRLETDPDKRLLLFERRYLLRKNWLRLTVAKDPPAN